MKKRKYILLLFSLFCLVNTQASNHLKWANKFLAEYQVENQIGQISPIYNGYAKIYKPNCIDCCSNFDIIDIKKKAIVSDVHENMSLTKVGYILFYDDLPQVSEEDTFCFGNLKDRKIKGDTILLDNVFEFYPMKDNFIAYRKLDPTYTSIERVLYKKGNVVQRDTFSSWPKDYCDVYIYDKYRLVRSSHKLYDENLNVVLEGDIRPTKHILCHNGFVEYYPMYTSFFLHKDGKIFIFNDKCGKKQVLPMTEEELCGVKEKDESEWCRGFIWEKKLIVTEYQRAGHLHLRVFKLDGTPLTPEKHNFSGYFKNILFYDNKEETFAVTMDGTKINRIKLGKCSLEKSGKKWILKSRLSTDSIDLITGLNSNQHIGIKKGMYNGIIDKNGNTIIPTHFDDIYIDKPYYIGIKDWKSNFYDKRGKLLADRMPEYLRSDDYLIKPDSHHYHTHYVFDEGNGKYRYFHRNKKKSKVFYADEINTLDLSNRYLPIKKDGIWQYLEIK